MTLNRVAYEHPILFAYFLTEKMQIICILIHTFAYFYLIYMQIENYNMQIYIKQKHHDITINNLQEYLNLISFKQTLAKHHYYHNQMVIFWLN